MDSGSDTIHATGLDAHTSVGPLASRIRGLRENASMTQGELASRVFVSRQTVINWEKGRTLPDAESLKRLSSVLGITLDALLDERSEERLRQIEGERKIFKLAILFECLWFLEKLIGVIVVTIAHKFLDPSAAYQIADVERIIGLAISLAALIPWFKVGGIKIDHDLQSVVEIAAYLEGYPPGAELPQTFAWRWLLPHWTLVTVTFVAFALVLTYIPLIALRLS